MIKKLKWIICRFSRNRGVFVQALFISILAYHLLHTIRYQLKHKGIHESWQTLRQVLQTHCRITTTLQLKNNQSVTIRKTCSPDVNQSVIYKALGIADHPGRTEKIYI